MSSVSSPPLSAVRNQPAAPGSLPPLPPADSRQPTPLDLPRALPAPVGPTALGRAPQRPTDAASDLPPVRAALPSTPKSTPPAAPAQPADTSAVDGLKPLAIKAQVDDLLAQLPALQRQHPAVAQQIEELAPVFHHALLAKDVYADQSAPALLPKGYARLSANELAALHLSEKDLVDPKSGYFAAVYKTPEGRYVVANRGTTSGDTATKDWKTNLQQGAGQRARQYDLAIRTALKITAAAPGQVEFVGHSKGGGLAQAQALATHSKAVVFNAAAVHHKTLARHDAHNRHANGLVRAYNVGGEVLNRLQDKTPGIVPSVRGGRYELSAVVPPKSTPEGLAWKGEMGRVGILKNAVQLHGMDSVIDSLGWQFENLRRDTEARPPAANDPKKQ